MGRRSSPPPAVAVGVLGFLFALYGFLYWFHRAHDKRAHRLVDVPIQALTGIRRSFSGEVAVELKREEDRFVFVKPYPGIPVDPRSIKNYLAVLERIPVRRRWPVKEDPSVYGIGPSSPRLTLITPQTEYTYALGNKNPVAPEFFVSVPPRGEVGLIPAPLTTIFQVDGADFRNRRLLPTEAEPVGWEFRLPNRPALKGEKRGEEWMVSENNSPSVPGDRQKSRGVLDRLRSLRLSDFEALDNRLSPFDAGVSSPVARLTVRFATGPAVELAFGTVRGKSPLTVAVNGEIRGGVPRSIVDDWPRGTADLQRNAVVDFPFSTIVRFTSTRDSITAVYERQRGKWYRMGRERRPVDLRSVQLFLLALAKIKIKEFDFKKSVDPVEREYAFFNSEGNPLLTLRLGTESDGQVPATFAGAPYRFLISAEDAAPLNF